MQQETSKKKTDGYQDLAMLIILPKIERYKELVKLDTKEAHEEIHELDDWLRSDEFMKLTGYCSTEVENLIDGLKNGGKYFRYRKHVY